MVWETRGEIGDVGWVLNPGEGCETREGDDTGTYIICEDEGTSYDGGRGVAKFREGRSIWGEIILSSVGGEVSSINGTPDPSED